MTGLQLDSAEEEALYALLKPREERLPPPLQVLLRRVERTLFERLTIAEIEELAARYPDGR